MDRRRQFQASIWQHGDRFEPTLVLPYAINFAKSADARIYGVPYGQFLIESTRISYASAL
jgi:hypothetical protein